MPNAPISALDVFILVTVPLTQYAYYTSLLWASSEKDVHWETWPPVQGGFN